MRKAFTLFELLVVISVIAVLASMLMPAISMIRQVAIGTTCANSLRQFAIGNQSFAIDNEGFAAPAVWANYGVGFGGGWGPLFWHQYAPFATYVDRDPGAGDWVAAAQTWPGSGLMDQIVVWPISMRCPAVSKTTWNMHNSYSYWYKDPWWNATQAALGTSLYLGQLSMAQVKRPSETIMFGDGSGAWLTAAPADANSGLPLRHRGRGNIVCADGHIESLGASVWNDVSAIQRRLLSYQ